MKSKEDFKIFVKQHPELIGNVKSGKMTWQGFYELYSLYDEDHSAWGDYLKKSEEVNLRISNPNQKTTGKSPIGTNGFGIQEVLNMFKGVKPETLQQNINSIQKFLGFVSEFVGDKGKIATPTKSGYTPRPTGKIFED